MRPGEKPNPGAPEPNRVWLYAQSALPMVYCKLLAAAQLLIPSNISKDKQAVPPIVQFLSEVKQHSGAKIRQCAPNPYGTHCRCETVQGGRLEFSPL